MAAIAAMDEAITDAGTRSGAERLVLARRALAARLETQRA
jgi:hypothetical protein